MYSLEVKDIIMKYDNFTALSHVSLKVKKGEFLTLLGPSGCGKTTLLKIISGFIEPSNGNIFINQVDVTKTQPETRNTAMCFQSYALFPHLTVIQNLSFGLIQRNVDIKKREQILDEVVTQLELTSELKKLPNQLSGGQQQRVALGRALVMRPEVILFDEPLSNLDALLRESVRIEIKMYIPSMGMNGGGNGVAIPKNAPNPHAALVFANWLLSAETQTGFNRDFGAAPLHPEADDSSALISNAQRAYRQNWASNPFSKDLADHFIEEVMMNR